MMILTPLLIVELSIGGHQQVYISVQTPRLISEKEVLDALEPKIWRRLTSNGGKCLEMVAPRHREWHCSVIRKVC